MSLMFYGAVRLGGDPAPQRSAVIEYWQQMAAIHQLWIELELQDSHSDPVLAELEGDDAWLSFRISATSDVHDADGLMLQCSQAVVRLPQWNRDPDRNPYLWMRVPQWRCLWCILNHEALTDAYLVVDDATGDTGYPEDAIQATVFEALDAIWRNYVLDFTEDAYVYRLDLAPQTINRVGARAAEIGKTP